MHAMHDFSFVPAKHRYIASPGRVGSTLIHKMLREAGIESISETWVDCYAPNLAWKGAISKTDSIALSKMDSHLLFDETDRPSFIVKKLAADSSRYLEALLGEDDDVVFLYREIESWVNSWQRMGTAPNRVAGLLLNTLHAHVSMVERNKIVRVLSYNDLVECNEHALNSAFGDIGEYKWNKYALDSQDETHLSRTQLNKKIPKYSVKEYFDEIKKTASLDIAKDLGLGRIGLVDVKKNSSLIAVPISSAVRAEREVVDVVPSNKWGNIDHYYHFIFGLLLPFLSSEMDHFTRSHYYFPDVGPMGRHMEKLAEKGWVIETQCGDRSANFPARTLAPIGWDHPSVYDIVNIERVSDFLFKTFDISRDRRLLRKNIVIIDRGVIASDATSYGANGSQRRSIPNIYDLYSLLKDRVEIEIVQLDTMDIVDQIKLFSHSNGIIAQHGAALSNLIFCKPKTTVIEILDPTPRSPFFSALSKRMDLNHILFYQDHAKAPIDTKAMIGVLKVNSLI